MQVDNLNELPKEKRVPENLIWEGTPEQIESWLEKVLSGKMETRANIVIRDEEIEG